VIKVVFEIVLALVLHPVAFVLCVIDIVNRKDLSGVAKFLWIIVSFIWSLGPILYVLLGRGKLW
jgi:uncharacterized Tic20 family protein